MLDLKLELSGFDLLKKSDRKFVKAKIKKALSILGIEQRLLVVHLCDDKEISELNQKFRGKDAATDVLSFEAALDEEDPFSEHILGDIAISLETAKRQAKELGHKKREEICALFVHGLMHILGFDHEKSQTEALRQAEAELFVLSGLDIAPEIALIGRSV